ncbi:aldose 1-epimerase [Baekduia soli]|uniref:aldose 1-epimerase n=1 Tax=Baekduia soli TaxID=496014 RepID=UPI001E57CEA5|nr:aldose 1-epimerase [Baekduia soli]
MSPADVTLRADDLEARWVPGAGMVGASLRHRGRELLGLRGGLDAYASRGSTFGIPLLHPWANRLGGFSYRAAGVDVALDATTPRLHTEEHGLPSHGLLAAYPGWVVRHADPGLLRAEADLGADPGIMEAFPFPHRLAMEVALAPGRLTVTTTLTPTSERPVPISFGFHPYLALPGVAREDLVLRHGPMTHLTLDDRKLPDGGREPVPARDAPLGGETLDDAYADLGPEPAFALAGGRRLVTVRFLEGFTHLQLFAPPGTPTVAIEPMTAPCNALRTGDGLRLATEPFTAAFAIDVDEHRP